MSALIMQKRVFIIHGWDGYPREGWFPWLKKELKLKGFQVQVPLMPKPHKPQIDAWVSHLSGIVGDADKNTFFVGHSIGCQTILRYLESLPENEKIGGAVFVAGWFALKNLSSNKEREIAKPWLETPIDFQKVKRHSKNFIAIFSNDDQFVPLENKDIFEQKLAAKIIIESKKGHFSGGDRVYQLPTALKAITTF